MANPVGRLDTLFIHGERPDTFQIAALRNNDHRLTARLEVVERDPGPRPGRFLQETDSGTEPRDPSLFIELARAADAIRISEQTDRKARETIRALLDGFQLTATVVRTCRYCASAGRYSPISSGSAISSGADEICRECASEEVRQELGYHGSMTDAAEERLLELLYEVRDVDRITSLLSGGMDPELTRVDTISATREAVDLVDVADLPIDAELKSILGERFSTLLPVQSLAVNEGLLERNDQLIVSATATGKTLIGEIAGIDRVRKTGETMLFLVPLVALANQTYRDFLEDYGELVDVTIRVGASRIRSDGYAFDPSADVIVGTYEGIDHALRTGRDLGTIGTVVIDEVHTLTAEERGHRLDGLITRLHHACRDDATQWLYLSATVGNPEWLAGRLEADLVEYADRPVPIERHVTFADGREKANVVNTLVKRAFDQVSSKGYRGQSIVFTNSRRRCHELARRMDYEAAAYHAGLDGRERRAVEERFAENELAAVVTTAALGAGVDFPASHVIFERLAMGIEWITVQEFEQMLGRAGRPDYHDQGTVYLLVEMGGTYHGQMERTEEEVAFALLAGETEDVRPQYAGEAAVEETLANVTVGGANAKALNDAMVGTVPSTYAIGKLLEYEFIDGFEPTPLGRVVTEHFLTPTDAFRLLEGIRAGQEPTETVIDVILRRDEER